MRSWAAGHDEAADEGTKEELVTRSYGTAGTSRVEGTDDIDIMQREALERSLGGDGQEQRGPWTRP